MSDKRKSHPAARGPAGESRPRKPASNSGGNGARGEKRPAGAEESERIAKRIARSGVASRRDAEAMILAGRVKVNGNLLSSPAFNVGPKDVILVDGERLPERERTRLFLFHKPAGTMTTNRDPEGRKTVFDVLPEGLPRLVTVGRLDFTTEGLLLMTNDGGLARVLELPSTGWLRRYRVRVHGEADPAALEKLKEGIAVDGVLYGAIDAELERRQGSNAWLVVSLREGKNREIKNVMGALGLDVTRLIRISYGPFQLGGLEPGSIVELKGRTLRDQLGERLIAEAGADFEADILKPFSSKPVKEKPTAMDKPARHVGRDRQSLREEALGRLQTSKPDAGTPRGGKQRERRENKEPQDKKREFQPPRSRASNVWMAPGARPQPKKVRRVSRDEVRAERDKAQETPQRKKPRLDKNRPEKPETGRYSKTNPGPGKPGRPAPAGRGSRKPDADRRR